jgi:hypothetical protein
MTLHAIALTLSLLIAAPGLAQTEQRDAQGQQDAASLADLAGVWTYDFEHLATRDDIKALADSGRLKHILDFQGRSTIEITEGGALAVRGGTTRSYDLEPAVEGQTIRTMISNPPPDVPVTLRRLDDDTLLAGFAPYDEHPAFRFKRVTYPGSSAIGRWAGTGEHEGVRFVITDAGRVLLTGLEDRLISSAEITADGAVHTIALKNGDELTLTIDEGLARATLTGAADEPVELARAWDPMEWIEGSWVVEPEATRNHPFYGIWPEAFGNPAPPLDAMIAFYVRDGLHFGDWPMKPHSMRDDLVVFQVDGIGGARDQTTYLPFRRLDEHHTETLVLKLILVSIDAPQHAHDHAGHDHAGHDHPEGDHDH